MKNVKVLIFDLDDTLINYGGVTQQAWLLTCQKLVKEFKINLDALKLTQTIVQINNALWNDEKKRPKGNFSFYELRKSIVKEALSCFELENKEDIIEFLVQNYSQCKSDAIYMFEDVPYTLKELKKRGYFITLLTNGDSRMQREKLSRFQMETLFDGIFIDGEQGVGKPEKEAYNNILKMFHVKPFEACMIGDHYLWEVVAPKKYGLKTVWVHRGELGIQENKEIKSDFIIGNISELLDIFV